MTYMLLRIVVLVALCGGAYLAGLHYGRHQERQRQRLLSMVRRRPLMWHEIPSAWNGDKPQLPDLSRWKRGGLR